MQKTHQLVRLVLILAISTLAFNSSYSQTKDIPNGYYDDAEGLSGYTLKTAHHNIIKSGHYDQGYSALYDAYVQGDTDPEDGKVWDMYSENPDGADPYNYTHYNNQCGNYSSEGDCYNREHLFPQGIFGSAAPMKADYHHVVPSDGKVNGMRGSYPFGETNNPNWTSMNGSKRGSCSYPGYGGTVFEPIDEFKGDIARCMLYFATRYEDRVGSWSHEMIDGSSDQVYRDWFIEMLVEWHLNDPVSSKDIMRNEAGYDHQGNRNPFIDHPEFVTMIWGGNNPSVISDITVQPQEPTENDAVNISANITDDDGISNVELAWGTSSNALNNTISMTLQSGSVYKTSTGIPAQSNLTTVYYKITATDNQNMPTSSSVNNYTVGYVAPTVLFEDDFESANLNKWTSYSVTGNQEWEIDDEHGIDGSVCAKMSGYDGQSNTNEDWLITSLIDLTHVPNGMLSFYSACNYDGDDIQVKYSTNYSGTGNPASANWSSFSNYDLSYGEWTWTNSGDISMANLEGSKIYIAFVYTSDNNSSKTWEIDNVKITGSIESSINTLMENSFSLYPNPCNDVLNIELINSNSETFEIFQADGRLVKTSTLLNNKTSIDVSSLINGTYFIKVGNAVEKIIIQ